MKITKGQKVLIKNLSLSFSDYKNIDGNIIDVDGDLATVSIPRSKIASEDLRDLRKDKVADRMIVKVRTSNIV